MSARVNARGNDYGWRGRLGVGVPPANPVVESEFRRIVPAAVDVSALRLVGDRDDSRTRLADYLERIGDALAQFQGMPLDAFLFACTASSYLVDAASERRIVEGVERQTGIAVITAADALAHWLQARQARRLALLSPYPAWLQTEAQRYWRDRGFDIVATETVGTVDVDTRDIYALGSSDAGDAWDRLANTDADAWLIAGTGLASLELVRRARAAGRTAVSSNLALAEAGCARLGVELEPAERWQLRGDESPDPTR